MKKVCLFITLSVFALGSSGFKSHEIVNPEIGYDCGQHAQMAYNLSKFIYPGDQQRAYDKYNEAYFDCLSDGGYAIY
jgi:hypothetical protein